VGNIKMDLRERLSDGTDLFGKGPVEGFVNTILKLRLP
jgi:hypothetical protein